MKKALVFAFHIGLRNRYNRDDGYDSCSRND